MELDPTANAYYNRGASKYNLGDKNGGCLDFSKAWAERLAMRREQLLPHRGMWSKYLDGVGDAKELDKEVRGWGIQVW